MRWLTNQRPLIRAAREKAYQAYLDGCLKAYNGAWKIVETHLPATAKMEKRNPYVGSFLDAFAVTKLETDGHVMSLHRRETLDHSRALLTKAGPALGTLADLLVLKMIRDHMQTEFHLGAQESAKALAAGEQAWFASQGLKYVPPSGKALYAQYIQEFEHKRGGFKSIADGTTDDVLGKVHEWYDNPGSVNDLRSALHDQFTPYNAERVARSESTRMASVQTTSMMADWGETKWRWESNGQNPCDECSALDGQVFELGEMEMPPDGTHPNCECSASTLLPDEMPEGGGAQTRKRDVGNWLDIADIRTTPEWSQALDWRYQLGHYCYLRRMMGAANCSLQPARPRPSSFPTPETNPSYCRKCGVKLNRYHVATYCYAHGG